MVNFLVPSRQYLEGLSRFRKVCYIVVSNDAQVEIDFITSSLFVNVNHKVVDFDV